MIRRLLRQKLECVADNLVAQTEPSEEQLQSYLREPAERFRGEPSISLRHVYLAPQRRGEALACDAAQLREQLDSTTVEVSTAGDVTSLEAQLMAVPPSAIAQIFGESFAAVLLALDTGRWSAPIASAYARYLVYASTSEPGADPALQQVREVVRREWMHARRKAAIDPFCLQLQQRYRVSIERPDPASGADKLADLRHEPWRNGIAIPGSTAVDPNAAQGHGWHPAVVRIVVVELCPSVAPGLSPVRRA